MLGFPHGEITNPPHILPFTDHMRRDRMYTLAEVAARSGAAKAERVRRWMTVMIESFARHTLTRAKRAASRQRSGGLSLKRVTCSRRPSPNGPDCASNGGDI